MTTGFGLSHSIARNHLTGILGAEIDDPEEETFLTFSEATTSGHDLGMVAGTAAVVDVSIGSRNFTIVQSPGLLQSNAATGTTGAALWKVTPHVAAWLADKGSLFWQQSILSETASIIELGCGVAGLIGLAMAPVVSRYILTDQAYIMKVLRQNISANQSSSSRSRVTRGRRSSSVLQILPLDWETDSAINVKTALGDRDGAALVVACDCIYNDFLIKPFVRMCQDVCSLRPNGQTPTVVLVAQQLRSDEVFVEWLQAFSRAFHVWRLGDNCLPQEMKGGSGYVVHLGIKKEENGKISKP